jgi:lipoprotein-anchoring transpeptidase ErfK/SrfK
METKVEKHIEKPLEKHKKIIIGIASSVFTLFVIYFGMSLYFMNHFYYGSEINGINVSGKAVKKVNEQMALQLQAYTLTLKERGDKSEQIKADEIGLKYNSDGDFKSLKESQSPYRWISAVFNKEALKMTEGIKFDNELLKERVDKLSCFDSVNIVEPKNASFKLEQNGYVLVNEVSGNKVDKDILYRKMSEAIFKKEVTLDLEIIDCYIKPQYTSNSEKVMDTKKLLDKYTASKITYTFGDNKEVLDSSTISKWLTVDENFVVVFDELKAKEYVDILAKTYNTVGKTRNLSASSGRKINVGGGDYGWSIDTAKETEVLIAAVKEGQAVEKEPQYIQTALAYGSNDIGNTYVEIDMTKQHLWFYKNGALITQGDIVTGNVSAKNTTPPGVFKLKYKEKNATLDGEDYSVPVSFWMPFNRGIGIHDAIWRDAFGGNIYKTNGSHGCVNSPYNLAQAIFNNITPGTPIICYN